MRVLNRMLKDNLSQIDALEEKKADAEEKVDEAIKEAENATKKAAKAKKELKEIAPLVNDVKSCKLHDKYQELVRDYNSIWVRRERLQQRYYVLEERVEELEVVEKDYGRIRKLFGAERIDGLLCEVKEQERMEAEMEKERRKIARKKEWI